MLEGLAAWILRTYVGEYVENLNTEQLSIGVGTVDLHNLPLKKTALQGLDLPLEVKSGFIGHLQLSIPLRRPKSEPWIINIDKLYLVAGPPLHNNEYNEQQEAEREWIRKKRQLDLLESQWQESQQKGQTGGFWSGSWWPSLYSSFSTTIVENLQLVISDVHIRYEDASIDQHTPFACGITIDRLAAQSTNDKWETEEVIQNDHSIKYKLIDLQNFAIYWDSDAPLVGDLPSTKLEVALQRTIDKSSGSIGKHSYILESISASAKLQRNATALPLRDKNPRFVVDVHVERIPLSLAEVQYRMGMKLMGEFERFFRQARYHKWRPKVPVKNNAKLWWQFASTCILHFIQERNRHHTLSFATKRAHDLVVYVKLYTEHLMSNQLESAKKEELERIEQELSFEELAVLRRLAMRKAEKALELVKASTPDVAPVAPSEPTSTASQGWLGGWYSWYWSADGAAPSKTGDATDNTKPPFKIEPPSTKEEEEFLDELSDPSRNQSIFNRDKVFARLNICLDSGSFKLLNSTSSGHSSTPIVEVEFCNATWESEVRPQSSTWEFNMSLGAIHARDRFTKGTLFASLVSPQERKPLAAQKSSNHSSISMLAMSSTALGLNILQEFDEEPVFEMRFEQMPPKSKVAYRFSITTQPLDIVWNPSVIDRVSDFFSNDTLSAQYVNVERQLREAAWLRYEELKNQTKAELKQTLDSMMEGVQIGNVKSWDIQLEVSAPRFFVPENFKDRKSSVVLVDFGHLSFKNSEAMEREKRISEEEDTDVEDDSFVTPMSTPPSEQEDENDAGICSTESAMRLAENLNPEKIKEAMYDKYMLVFSDIQMVVCHARDKWSDVTSHHFGSSDLHVVDRFTIKLTLERRLIFTADPQCPAVLLSGNLPSLTFHVNEYKCHALTKCFNQLIRPSKSPTVPPRDMRAMATSTPLRHPQGPASEFDMNHSMDELYYSMYSSQVTLDDSADILSRKTSEAVLESALESKTKELLVESRQMVVQFTIDRVSCAVHSRARLIAELQVHRVATEYLKRPYDSSVSFKVHGLYLVDAIQCYGPEFDLLVSSSKPSWTGPGSDSFSSPDKGERTLTETVSSAFSAMADFVRPGSKQEKSPASEDSILKGVTLPSLTSVASAFTSMADRVKPGTHQVHSPDDSSFKGGHIPSVSSAFSAMAGMIRPGSRQDRCSSADTIVESPMPSATLDENDLISLEYLQVSKDCPSTEKALRMATLQFNSLFCIANQETLAVLAQFFNVAFPSGVEESPSHRLTSVPEETIPPGVTGPTQADEDQAPLEINASFCSINILLARSIKTNNMKTIRKVADVTVSEVLITCSLVDGLTISGSLGGLRIMDLTPEGSQHRCALTCGTITDPNPKDPYIPDKLPEDDDDEPSDLCAFRFKLIRPSYGGRLPEVIVRPADDSPEEAAEISKHVQVLVEMASAQYTHTQRFLSELMLCGGDYAQAAKDVGETLRQAASNVAMGLVSKKKSLVEELDYLSSSFMATNREPEGHSSRRHSLDEGISGEILLEGEENEDNYTAKPNRRVYMYVSIETPVVHLPRSSSSRDVLVANLGEIKIRNTHMLQTIEEQEDEDVITVDYDIDRVQVDIQDMSLYSITLSPEHLSRISSGHTLSETLLGGSPSKVPKTGIHILHRTGFQLLLDRQSVDEQGFRSGLEQKKPTICVEARVSTPLKLELSTYTYKQLMDTVDNLGGGEDNVKIPPPASEHGSVAGSPPTQSPTLSPSSSSSNLEAYFDKSVTTKVSFAPLEGHHVNSSDHLEPLEPSHAEEPDDPTPIVANVTVPHFSIKLCGELQNVEHEIVDIKFSDFYLNYQNVKPTLTQFEVYLGGLLVQDLFQDPTSDYAYLMSSSNPRGSKNRARSLSAYHSSLSTSCPTISECGLTSDLSSSLPSYLPESPRRIPFRTLSPLRPLKHGQCPSLPAVRSTLDLGMDSGEESAHKRKLNERRKLKENALVTCYVTLVKNDDEEFETKYKSVHRRVQVDFNSLDTVINLQTWVLVLEFFGIGVAPPPSQASSPVTPQAPANFGSMDLDDQMPLDTSPDDNKSINTKVDIQVASLTLTVNKSQYPLAKAKVTGLSCYLDMSEGNMAAEGKLTNISLTDMSPHGALYREKFKTCGKEALSFQFFKYGEPDLDLDRPFDMSLVLRMSSVQYVHTKRFQSELVAFCQHYLQLQEVLGRIRAEDAGNAVSWMIGRGSRVLLDIQAGSPVILVPRSAKSSHMLVADLGDLTLKNCFLWEESPGTISHNTGQKRRTLSDASKAKTRHTCLLDCMTIDLVDMDLFTAVREPEVPVSREFTYTPQGVKLLKEKCRLNLQVERNLDWAFSRAVPDFLFSGRLSSVSAGLDYSQYCLILGLLGENFGEELEEFERPSSYLHDPLGPPPESEDVWTTLRMSIVLVNVSLELLPVQLFEHPEQASDAPLPSLARIDFIRSTFEFETFSDWSKTIDLVSSEVIFEDTREMDDADPCVFTEVLMPKRSASSPRDDEDSLQFEVHYRDTLQKTLMTILFNHSRIVMILDYLLDTYNFIMCRMFNDDEPKDQETTSATTMADETLDQEESVSKATSPQTSSPAQSGVVTKCELPTAQAQVQKTFELKVNISGTEFVVLESLGTRDTNAVVLKLTAVLAWRPHLQTQKWLSCSIQNLEMFSCIFSCEEDTAQSIIDPTTALIDLNNARRQLGRRTVGLLEITSEPLPSVEITLQSSFNMRISYNDYKLYLSIFDSVMRQLNKAMKTESKAKQEIPDHDFDDALVRRLMELGFEEVDCINALIATAGRLEASATWLLENATPIIPAKQGDGEGWQFAGFEVRAGTVCVCLIDDCGDTDVPLIELSTQGLYFWHDLQATGDGAANCTLTVEYYNRMVSGWEPWIEPWKCQLHWQQQQKTKKTPKRLLVKLDAPDRLDITVTTVLINMINQTLSSWTEDLYGRADSLTSPAPSAATSSTTLVAAGSSSTLVGSRARDDSFSRSVSVESGGGSPERRPESSTSLVSLGGQHRRRAPFVPYAIRNNTGCLLMFRTITTTPSRVIITNTGLKLAPHDAHGPGYDKMSEWREVAAGEEIPFEFSSREKMRHKDTHDFIVHQIVVQVEGWAPVTPVSVDRVGKFFRQAQPQATDGNPVASDIHPARIVFDVTLEGGARKVVSVQSSLSVLNKTDIPVEVKLQGPTSYQGHVTLPPIQPHKHMCIPLRAVTWQLYARPQGVSVGFCSEPMEWKSVTRTHHTVGYARECHAPGSTKKFRFCAVVRREGFPEDDVMSELVYQPSTFKLVSHPAHTISIVAPVVLINLLPCDLSYQVKSVGVKGDIKAGRSTPIYSADPDKPFDLGFSIENFTYCENLRVTKRGNLAEHPITHVELRDTNRRSLVLNVLVIVRPGGALRISIFAPYWMVNNTGIPLIFRQEGSSHEMAGQFEEHEMARSLTPLLFSFIDRDTPGRCQMRIGNSYHAGTGKPIWCSPFSLDTPREFNRVHARQADGRPDKVYDIGIDVRFGRGRFCLTRIVTFATRYQLENKTPHTLAFSQRHFVRDQGTRNPDGTLTALPGALVLFHWARTDLDQLLCIRLNDVSHCQWSGGFKIDRDDSFHINMRSLNGCSLFVRVEIMLKGATFHVLFSDASQLPPPYRIDNLSEVPVKFFQSGTEDRLRTILQAKQSVPYSWDEPTLPPELSLGVVDGSSYARYFMNILGSGERLYYYNPIYIVFTHTFTSTDGHVCGSFHARSAAPDHGPPLDRRELVLDVPQGTAVILRRKEPLKRSQLWRMTGTGLLRHEGSSPLSDPRKPSTSSSGLVLDIDSLAPPTCGKYVRLVLSKPNTRRKHSQTWAFTEDGRMTCGLPGLFVQSRGGISGLRDGVDAVLGPANITKEEQIPLEQCISTCKLRPGSGCMAVKVIADGPTRVLRITDSLLHGEEEEMRGWLLVEQKGALGTATVTRSLDTDPQASELVIQVRLAGGIGVSVVNYVPEELVYGALEQIEVDYVRTPKIETLEANIGRIQVDNQLFNSTLPVLLYPTAAEKGSREEHATQQPTLHISASKEPTRIQNVEIYKGVEVTLRRMTLHVEERLLLKLLQFFGYVQKDDDLATTDEEDDECLYDNQRAAVTSSGPASRRYYFERLQINPMQLKVSVASAGRLSEDLASLKSSLGLILFNLEDATLDLESFIRDHPFESLNSHLDSMSKHYTEELRSQTAAIVGSIDFLGNPMGLLNDVSSGLEGLVKRGNVGGLFLNVAHGVSDSAAKITGSLSDGLWNASMDTKFKESRETMRAERYGSSRDHFMAGMRGLGMGLVGGLTSIVTQPIEGAHNAGLSGFMTGLAKGIVGTVAKPTAGVLDFASGTAAAVRGQATRSSRYFPPKCTRPRRNCFGPNGSIPRYSRTHAEGQEIMLKLNENNFNEKFVLSESVRRDKEERLKAIITTEGVYFVRAKGTPSPEAIVLLVKYCDLYECQPLSGDGRDYIELVMKADNSSVPTPSKNPSKRPRVRCDSGHIANRVAQKINYSKNLYDEVQQTVIPDPKEPVWG
ncbi:intermembrane lipid transfer protein VPS13D isoform X3 [Nematostella vectensis]|uniref:intermembrane lipid transfer protein VPS13D isoform X3 n=1 Tax=Nematostella vectensis TaxID=45351 RepID=UPI00207728E7|nr:intermembrane lipid transfer protein VPS13D isoform X3 [Nematostella vectensis]